MCKGCLRVYVCIIKTNKQKTQQPRKAANQTEQTNNNAAP